MYISQNLCKYEDKVLHPACPAVVTVDCTGTDFPSQTFTCRCYCICHHTVNSVEVHVYFVVIIVSMKLVLKDATFILSLILRCGYFQYL